MTNSPPATQTSAESDDAAFPADLLVSLDRSAGRGLRRQLEQDLRRGVQEGRLAPGTVLPPTRRLARELGVARSVVVEAYDQLVAEGYLEARQGSKTRVRIPEPTVDRSSAARRAERPPSVAQFVNGLPDPASFPRADWQRHQRRVMAQAPDAAFGHPEPQGASSLRDSLSGYLGRVRSVVTTPADIVICSGFSQALALLCRVLRARGHTRLALENPCFGYHRHLVAHTGLEPVAVPVDEAGIDVDRLISADVGAVLVAPAHSYPSGAVLGPERRVELVRWAREREAVVIEDDYDAEFRYDRTPIAALQGLAPERVVYGSSASKVLSPGLRLGWLVVPSDLVDELLREKLFVDLASGTLDQLTLARFVESGDLARHLRRLRPLYRRRRDVCVSALARALPDARVEGAAAGLHVLVRLPSGIDERTLVDRVRGRGVHVEGGAWHWASPDEAPPTVVLGYGAVSESAIERGIAALGAEAADAV